MSSFFAYGKFIKDIGYPFGLNLQKKKAFIIKAFFKI